MVAEAARASRESATAEGIYHPTPQLAELRTHQPVAEISFPDGSTGWLVTKYADTDEPTEPF